MTAAPTVESCTHCHVGDASIGNDFRGLAQLYPQQPAGPDVKNTTPALIAGQSSSRTRCSRRPTSTARAAWSASTATARGT